MSPTLAFAALMAWWLLSPLLALAFCWACRKLDTPDPFASCGDPMSFAGLD